ncbi:MAG: hypothetical protein IJW48_04655 [Clostridia bacterium]|nr:hypothetical protein [Clostridia bacterium]
MVIAFCGQSLCYSTEKLAMKVSETLRLAVGDKEADIYVGAYGIFDRLALGCCINYKKEHPGVRVFLVTPFSDVEYEKKHIKPICDGVDEVVYPPVQNVAPRYATAEAIKWAVDKADTVIAHIDRNFGVAYRSYQYAKALGRKIINLADKRIK